MQNINRLRWQCRRGVKELDAVLCDFLENKYATANAREQQLFTRLLALEDDQLLACFFINTLSDNPTPAANKELKKFIEKIRTAFVG